MLPGIEKKNPDLHLITTLMGGPCLKAMTATDALIRPTAINHAPRILAQ
jgi:hypothetical protein